MQELVRVVTSSESAARDASAIAAGIPSRALMQRAGAAAAAEIALRYPERVGGGVLVLAGPGNNGGDGWVVARALAAVGVRVRVVEPVEAKTDDARAERLLALGAVGESLRSSWSPTDSVDRGDALVVDALLGTGASGAPRGDLATAVEACIAMRARGAVVVALDVPSGAVVADLTITFGTVKRSLLTNREAAGGVVVVDIGLGLHAELDDGAPELVDERWVALKVPPIDASAHKGARKKVVVIGGAVGMAGAAMLAARAALRSGAGMVRLVVAPESMRAVQEGEPFALAAPWPADEHALQRDVIQWADAVVLGPGLGNSPASRALVEHVLSAWKGPVLLDADALNVFAGETTALARLIGDRAALVTPHPAEFARLTGAKVDDVLRARFEIGAGLARQLNAAVLLKGVPTVITSPSGARLVSAAGTPALATAGSGDVLCGIAGTLLAQLGDAFVAGATGAWVHGRAAELASPGLDTGTVRGVTLDDVLGALRDAWQLERLPSRYPVLAELPAVGER